MERTSKSLLSTSATFGAAYGAVGDALVQLRLREHPSTMDEVQTHEVVGAVLFRERFEDAGPLRVFGSRDANLQEACRIRAAAGRAEWSGRRKSFR